MIPRVYFEMWIKEVVIYLTSNPSTRIRLRTPFTLVFSLTISNSLPNRERHLWRHLSILLREKICEWRPACIRTISMMLWFRRCRLPIWYIIMAPWAGILWDFIPQMIFIIEVSMHIAKFLNRRWIGRAKTEWFSISPNISRWLIPYQTLCPMIIYRWPFQTFSRPGQTTEEILPTRIWHNCYSNLSTPCGFSSGMVSITMTSTFPIFLLSRTLWIENLSTILNIQVCVICSTWNPDSLPRFSTTIGDTMRRRNAILLRSEMIIPLATGQEKRIILIVILRIERDTIFSECWPVHTLCLTGISKYSLKRN